MKPSTSIEAERLAQQAILDASKTKLERNQLGQFATPTALANELMSHAMTLMPPDQTLRFLDPAVGTGSFFSALLSAHADKPIDLALGFEIDPHYGKPAKTLWKEAPFRVEIADFTQQATNTMDFNLVVSNPPYVRHHHLSSDTKARLQRTSAEASGMQLSGLSGLYPHFIAHAHRWMAPGALACWLIPSEFMDVNYGRELKRYLCERVTLIQIHRFDPNDAQFDDALVSSAVVWFRNTLPSASHTALFSFGGTHKRPHQSQKIALSELSPTKKWTAFSAPKASTRQSNECRIRDLFDIRRGIATGDNHFFILSPEKIESNQLPWSQLTPILPSPRYLSCDHIEADEQGYPLVDKPQFLVNCRLPEHIVREQYPSLWTYLDNGRSTMMARYICRNRTLWYQQENRKPAPFLCTYMGRADKTGGKPFRFILNRSSAIAANTYLNLYPKPHVARRLLNQPGLLVKVWTALNEIDPSRMLAEGRVYGGGLHKLEPKELAEVPAGNIAALLGLGDALVLDFEESPTELHQESTPWHSG